MTLNPILRACLFFPLVCIGVLAACDDSANPVTSTEEPDELTMTESPKQLLELEPLTVMSRNVYLGGDIGPVLGVGFGDLKRLSDVAAGVWGEIQGNDFSERAVALVDEIAEKSPDIVGIQELARFLILNLNFGTGSFDLTGVVDFETILEAELQARGLPYSFAAVQENTTVQVPVAGIGEGAGFIPTQLIRLTIRDAFLVRDGLEIQGLSQGNYAARVPLGVGPDGNPIELKRGWIRVDADVGGVPHHFITTHMEIQSFSSIQVQQAEELLNQVAGGLDGVTVLLGDFNSDAAASRGDPSWTPTHKIVTKAGFGDAWERAKWGRQAQGLTCCHLSDLSNPAATFDQRIDFIFVRTLGLQSPMKSYPGLMALDVIGDQPHDRTGPNQLWPSDHAGLVADFYGSPSWFHRLR